MAMFAFARRTAKEILRDPLTVLFGLGFPVVLLLLLSAIQANVPVDLYRIERLFPGIAVFGMAFLTLFSATLISRDRSSAFLQRLYTTPLTPAGYILGYMLPLFPMALAQYFICWAAAVILGLPVTIHCLSALVSVLPISLVFISLGLLCGSVLTDKQVGGLCGALLTNLTAWFSGAWFDLKLVGGWFEEFAYALPFVHGVDLQREVLVGSYSGILIDLIWILGYGLIITAAAIALFMRQMNRQ